MKKVIRLTESDLTRIVRRILNERFPYGNSGNSDLQMVQITYPIFDGYVSYVGHFYQDNNGVSWFIPAEDGFEFTTEGRLGGDEEEITYKVGGNKIKKLKDEFNRLVGKKLQIDSDYGPLSFNKKLPPLYVNGLINGNEGVKISLI